MNININMRIFDGRDGSLYTFLLLLDFLRHRARLFYFSPAVTKIALLALYSILSYILVFKTVTEIALLAFASE